VIRHLFSSETKNDDLGYSTDEMKEKETRRVFSKGEKKKEEEDWNEVC